MMSRPLINPSNGVQCLPSDTFKTGQLVIDEVIKGKDLSLDEINKLKTEIDNFGKRHRLRAVFKCKGATCISAHLCPFLRINRPDLLPVGDSCPVDTMLAEQIYTETSRYVMAINGDTELDIFAEGYVRELVAIELYVARIEDNLSDAGEDGNNFLTSVKIGAVNTRTGDPFYEITEHYLIQTRDRLLQRKDRILKALLITPESRARYKRDKVMSIAEKMKEMQLLAKQAVRELHSKGAIDLDDLKKRALQHKLINLESQVPDV